MIYKFDILFKKKLKSGVIKVVTYGSLLEHSGDIFQGEGFDGAEGELSMVLEGPEAGFSINALYRKYRAQLVGHMNAEMFGKDFPLRFVFGKADDPSSIRIELRDEDGYTYASSVHTERVNGSKTLDLSGTDSFVVLIIKGGECSIPSDDKEHSITLKTGQIAFCSESIKKIKIKTDSVILVLVSTSLLKYT